MSKEKRTLYPERRTNWFDKDLILSASIGTVLILGLVVFLVICFTIVPPTYGFF